MGKLKLGLSVLFTFFALRFLLLSTSAWAGCDCLFNVLQGYFILVAPVVGSLAILFFTYVRVRKGKSFLSSYVLFFFIVLVILKIIQGSLVPVSSFLEKKYPSLSPARTIPSIPVLNF